VSREECVDYLRYHRFFVAQYPLEYRSAIGETLEEVRADFVANGTLCTVGGCVGRSLERAQCGWIGRQGDISGLGERRAPSRALADAYVSAY
jgi:hypothetical protein